MAKQKMTSKEFKELTSTPIERRQEVSDGEITGLFLQLQPGVGRWSWAVRYRYKGKPRKVTLDGGPLDQKTARARAAEIDVAVRRGEDPAAEKAADKARAAERATAEQETSDDSKAADQSEAGEPGPVKEACDVFLRRYCKTHQGQRTYAETERMINKHVVPLWGNRAVGEIRKKDVLKLLDHLTDQGKGYAANKLLQVVKQMFAFWVERDLAEASPVVGLRKPTKELPRARVLSDDELRRLWDAAERIGWPYGPVARLLALTGCRLTEVAGMRWSEIDLAKREWHIPGERRKRGKPLIVPLSTEAVKLIEGLPRIGTSPLVFASQGDDTHVSGFNWAKRRLSALAGLHPETWRFHDLRRTLATGLERLKVADVVVSACLGHSRRGVDRHYKLYDHLEEKRKALQVWADQITRANVIELEVAHA